MERSMTTRRAILTLVLALLPTALWARDRTAETFRFLDGGQSTYYKFQLDPVAPSQTFVFFYGGTGCIDWKPYIPEFFRGINPTATIFALNKRGVDEDSSPTRCAALFPEHNLPRQWVADYMEFISSQIDGAKTKPANVVLVGISEGAYPAVKVARSRTDITHLLIIGDGGWTMRKSLEKLVGKDYVDDGWRKIAADANSLTQTWLGQPYRWWFDVMDIDPVADYLPRRRSLALLWAA
jgi:hypothetical protein